MKPPQDFYIGWEAKAAPAIGKKLRQIVIVIFLMALLVPASLALSQRLISQSTFEWGKLKTFSGTFKAQPYPQLLVRRPGQGATKVQFSSYYLVAPWKFGLARDAIASFDEKIVRLKGTLIYRENQTMIETKPEWIQITTNSPDRVTRMESNSLGKQTLTGEIVDSKCFLGVMNPGQLTPHRACAIRCISGGVPPVLLVRQKEGPALYFLLVSSDSKPVNQQVLELVAEPVTVTGEVLRQGDLLILRADPATYRRVNR